MEISKLTLTSQTKELLSYKGLDASKKRNLKENKVYDFIRQQPDGVATMQQLAAAAGYNVETQYATGYAFIKRMQSSGLIQTFDNKTFKKRWVITEEVAKKAARKRASTDRLTDAAVTFGQEMQKIVDKKALLEKAKEFAWTHNSDSLREFMEWLEVINP